MGIYSNTIHEGYNGVEPSIQDTLESIMLDESVEPYEGEDFTEGALAAVCDIHENYNLFMNQIGIAELASVENTGSLMVYTEGVLSDMVSAIKNFLKKIWEKIRSLFKRFMMIVDSYTKTDKEFVTKYKKEIYSGKSLEDFTFKGWKFSNFDKVDNAINACQASSFEAGKTAGTVELSEDELKEIEDKYDDNFEKDRGKIISLLGGKGGSYNSSEFTKELHAVFRSNEDSKEELDEKDIKISNIANELMTSKETKKILNDAFKAAKKAIDTDEKEVERKNKEFLHNQPLDKNDYKKKNYSVGHNLDNLERAEDSDKWKQERKNERNKAYDPNIHGKDKKEYEDTSEHIASWKTERVRVSKLDKSNYDISGKEYTNRKSKSLSLFLRTVRDTKSTLLQVEGACLNALKERSRQNKAIIIKYVSHKPKKESNFTESVQMGYTPFSNIVLR